MSAIQMIAVGRKLSNIYSELSLPICRKYGIWSRATTTR